MYCTLPYAPMRPTLVRERRGLSHLAFFRFLLKRWKVLYRLVSATFRAVGGGAYIGHRIDLKRASLIYTESNTAWNRRLAEVPSYFVWLFIYGSLELEGSTASLG